MDPYDPYHNTFNSPITSNTRDALGTRNASSTDSADEEYRLALQAIIRGGITGVITDRDSSDIPRALAVPSLLPSGPFLDNVSYADLRGFALEIGELDHLSEQEMTTTRRAAQTARLTRNNQMVRNNANQEAATASDATDPEQSDLHVWSLCRREPHSPITGFGFKIEFEEHDHGATTIQAMVFLEPGHELFLIHRPGARLGMWSVGKREYDEAFFHAETDEAHYASEDKMPDFSVELEKEAGLLEAEGTVVIAEGMMVCLSYRQGRPMEAKGSRIDTEVADAWGYSLV